jgi:hypothetical protein
VFGSIVADGDFGGFVGDVAVSDRVQEFMPRIEPGQKPARINHPRAVCGSAAPEEHGPGPPKPVKRPLSNNQAEHY